MAAVGTIVWLVLGAVSFVSIFNLVGGGQYMRDIFLGLGLPAMGTIIVMMAVLVVLGTFMQDGLRSSSSPYPFSRPLVMSLAPELGLTADQAKVWFGILFVMNIQIYFLSPPLARPVSG
ncbi:MAG: TRAP transporter large permease subunit [Geminicoccaceae bacterium]